MAFSLANTSSLSAAARPAARGSRTALRVRAQTVPANVADARKWIATYNAKTEAAANRPSWFPGTKLPAHLDGTLVGDFGFDPLSLGVEKDKLRWYQQAELVHARFAMLAVAGILGPELFSSIGISWPGAGVPWYEAGAFTYFAPAKALFGVQMLLFAWVEMRRYQDYQKPGSAGQDPIFANNKLPDGGEVGYPGGIFDPFGWSKGDLPALKLKELKNGRLAMLAFAGFAAQAYTTHTTPLANLGKHLSDPWGTTVFSNDLARL